MFVRKYVSEDCKEILKMFYECVHTVTSKDYTKVQQQAWASGDEDESMWNLSFLSHNTVVAIEDEVIVGFGDMDEFGYLDRLYVHKDYQRNHIASSICDALEKASSATTFLTYASISAKPFFEQRGYYVVNEQVVERRGVLLVNYVMKK